MKTLHNSVVALIIINWNNAPDTIACLASLEKTVYDQKRIIIVDNFSKDNSLAQIKAWAAASPLKDELDFVMLSDNLGFTGGNNAGIDHAIRNGADYVLLLNNDTLVKETFLADLIACAQRHPQAGVIGCKIYHYPETKKIWYSGGKLDFIRGYGCHQKDDFSGERTTGFVTGCLMLIPAEVIKKVGMLDDKYFLISEDSDLCQRVKKAGYTLMVNCGTFIFHKVSATAGGHYSKVTQYYFHRNRMIFMKTLLSGPQKALFYVFQFLIVIPAWSLFEILRGNIHAVKWALRGYKDFLNGKTGKCEDL
jgi:GT2 family glycosyltransferase